MQHTGGLVRGNPSLVFTQGQVPLTRDRKFLDQICVQTSYFEMDFMDVWLHSSYDLEE